MHVLKFNYRLVLESIENIIMFFLYRSSLMRRKSRNFSMWSFSHIQSYTFPYENPPFLGSQKFDFIGLIITIFELIITIFTAKPQNQATQLKDMQYFICVLIGISLFSASDSLVNTISQKFLLKSEKICDR